MAGKALAPAMMSDRNPDPGWTRSFRLALITRTATAWLLAASALFLFSCSSSSDQIIIGSKNFTESLILGELMAQQIEAHTHLKVERRFYLAGTYICHQAMLAGRIDIYPAYTATALSAILKQKPTT